MNDAIERSLRCWHTMIGSGDMTPLRAMLAAECVFRSPVAYQPYLGADRTALILTAAAAVFEDFRYHREFAHADSVALEFSARIGAVELKGIDLIRFDEAGRIVEFEVMVRPATGLQALAQAMASRLAARSDD